MTRRVLIIGASGFIGQYLFNSLSNDRFIVAGTYCNKYCDGLIKLNALNVDEISQLLENFQPEFVLFLAGTKNVDMCEKNPEYGVALNIDSVRAYIAACLKAKLLPKTIYFSTDYVFDGVRGHYKSSDVASPTTIYGITNLIAERLLINSDVPTLVLRVSAVMGLRGGFYSWLHSSLLSDQEIELFDNTYFSPTTIGRVCKTVRTIIEKDSFVKANSIIHLSDGYRMTRHEFGRIISSFLGKKPELAIPKSINTTSTSFQSDLSLLPEGLDVFNDPKDWSEMEEIY